MGQVRATIFVSGLVQGVYFRADACDAARQLGLHGWIRNRRDGRVEAVVEGEEAAVQRFIAWCRRGPPSARVEHVQVDWQPYQGEFDTFSIRG